jgi:hypothetical protein
MLLIFPITLTWNSKFWDCGHYSFQLITRVPSPPELHSHCHCRLQFISYYFSNFSRDGASLACIETKLHNGQPRNTFRFRAGLRDISPFLSVEIGSEANSVPYPKSTVRQNVRRMKLISHLLIDSILRNRGTVPHSHSRWDGSDNTSKLWGSVRNKQRYNPDIRI